MIRVGVVTNPFDPRTWEEHEADDLRAFLKTRFPVWPSTARIYDLSDFGDWKRAASIVDPSVLATRDVTPIGVPGPAHEKAVKKLGQLRGPVMVVVSPADPLTAIIAVVAVAVGIAAAFLLMPKLPSGQKYQSSNNSLSQRTNQARLNQRIEDIFGTVESTPTLLAVPYVQFIGGREIEEAYMCVGRGRYAVSRVRDGNTNIASISGASCAIYGPNTSPNSGDPPQLQIGPAFTSAVRSVVKSNEVNGQTLKATNVNRVEGDDSIRFVYPDTIESIDSSIDFTEAFNVLDAIDVTRADISGSAGSVTTTASARFTAAGEIEFEDINPSTVFAGATTITIINGTYAGDNGLGGTLYVNVTGTYPIASLTSTKVVLDDPASVNTDWDLLDDYPSDRTEYRSTDLSVPTATAGINLDGSYTIAALTSNSIVLNAPELVNSAWLNLDDLPGGATAYISPAISRNSETWIGPFIIDLSTGTQALANFVATNGLYTLSKKGKQRAMTVGFALEVTPVNSSNTPIGPAEVFNTSMTGSATEKDLVGVSLWVEPSMPGRWSVRARRTTPSPDEDDYGGIVDEVKWREMYGFAPVDQAHFGDVTTVQSRTIATPGALALKERKLNMRVTRMLPERISGSTFGDLVATDSVDDILSAISLDPYIGRRSVSEIDFGTIYDTIAEVKAYFGSDEAAKFGYTFDDSDLSYQETAAIVAQAAFCTAYRQGNVVRTRFERATEDSTMILNARNIMPRTQTISVTFGELDDHDGVELDYTAATDGAAVTFQLPEDGSAKSPLSLEVVGVRSDLLAYWQAWRARNKAKYQNYAVDLVATQEAMLILPNDRVLIANRTVGGVLQGDVEAEDGTTLTLSHPAELDPGQEWVIFLQHTDQSVEALNVEAWVPGPGSNGDPYKVTLSSPPRQPLSTDDSNFAQAAYMIVPFTDVQTRAFLCIEQEPNNDATTSIRAVNYSFLYYQNDEVVLWQNFDQGAFYDGGPYRHDASVTGTIAIAFDADRGKEVAICTAAGNLTFPGYAMPQAYTKAAWLKTIALSGTRVILDGTSGTERFRIDSGNLVAGHAGANLSAPWPSDDEWHHAAFAYDPADGTATLFIDGEPVASGAMPVRTLSAPTALGNFSGRVDDLRVWKRPLTAREVHEVYLGSLKPF